MTTINLEIPARALAIGAHPDDIEFGCGGTLAKWAQAGCVISHLVCTDGSKGTWDPDRDAAKLIALRQEEQRSAARSLGGHGSVFFLGWPDGELRHDLIQQKQVAQIIREVRPQVVFGHDPWRRYRLHPDHRNAGFLTTDGIVAARDPLFFPDLNLEPWRPNSLLLFEADEVDHIEDVSSTFDQKIEALLEHRSQLESTMYITDGEADAPLPPGELEAFTARMRDRLSAFGQPHGLTLAEGFKQMNDL